MAVTRLTIDTESVMATDKQILRSKQGVTLTKVTLRSGSMPVDVVYVVASKRTSEAPNFHDEISAVRHFEAEVEQSRQNLI